MDTTDMKHEKEKKLSLFKIAVEKLPPSQSSSLGPPSQRSSLENENSKNNSLAGASLHTVVSM